MPAPTDSRLVAAMDDVVANLKLMGRERGFRHDYSGVVRDVYPRAMERDLNTPNVQLKMLGTAELENFGNNFRQTDEFLVQVHINAEVRTDGSPDMIRPWANVRADIFKALFVDSSRERGIAGAVMTYYRRVMPPPIEGDDEAEGATVREVYALMWDHTDGGMDVAP